MKPKKKKRERVRIFVSKVPGPGRLFHLVIRFPSISLPSVQTDMRTQRASISAAREMLEDSKRPGSIVVQDRKGRWREVFSYPPVRNKDERR